MKSINVLVFTYNQQDVIGRALDSVLCQREWGLNKIIVCDDCSKDGNVAVIEQYKEKYPDIIELHVNEHNLGIYGNLQYADSVRGHADFYKHLAGDDTVCDGWFKAVQEFFDESGNDCSGIPAVVYSDWKMIDLAGKETVFRQNLISDGSIDPMTLKLRGIVCTRSTLWSEALMASLSPIDTSRGVSRAETMYDEQAARLSKVNYYVPFVATVYYSGIGFSRKTHTLEYERQVLSNKQAQKESYDWDSKDSAYLDYLIGLSRMKIKPGLGTYFRTMCSYIKGRRHDLPRPRVSFVKEFTALFINSFLKNNTI